MELPIVKDPDESTYISTISQSLTSESVIFSDLINTESHPPFLSELLQGIQFK